ncbi:MAG: hypothetical protein RBT43_05755 [bacterium]|jgi:hypothetical protein|nr:hypothetical protein [bacterium]
MKKYLVGIGFGAIAGIIDVIPMLIMKLTWDANISAFIMWVIVGFLISSSKLNIKGFFKGILIAFLVLAPSAILIGWGDPKSLLPVVLMTLILGAVLGLAIDKVTLQHNK